MARDTIVSEIVTGKVEGIKDDWSFHQHGAQQQFGNYGLSFVAGMSFFSGIFSGTSLAFDERQLGIISTLIDQGYRWTVWRGKMDVSSLGRQLFHHAQVHKALSLAFSASELGGGESSSCASVALQFIAGKLWDDGSKSFNRTQTFLAIGLYNSSPTSLDDFCKNGFRPCGWS